VSRSAQRTLCAEQCSVRPRRQAAVMAPSPTTKVVAERLLQPLFCLRAGQRYDANAVILPEAVAA